MTTEQSEEKYKINVEIQHALGYRRSAGTTAVHVAEEEIVYLVGKHITVYHHDNYTHRLLIKQSKVYEVVCFCVSANRKYLAASEKLTDGTLQITLYNVETGNKIRTLECKYLSKSPIVGMSFSHDNKYLVTVTAMPVTVTNAAPEVFVYLWQLDKAWLLCMLDVGMEVSALSMSPWNFSSIACSGASTSYGGVKLLKYADKAFSVIDPFQRGRGAKELANHIYSCHAWVDDELLVVGTEEGDLVLAENSEFKELMHHVHGEGNAISVVECINRGFVCGGENGIFSIFERSVAGDKYFNLYRKFQDPDRQRIVGISISPSEQNVVLSFVNNSMSYFGLDNVDILQDNDTSCFQPIGNGFHKDYVTAMDACLQKSFLVTASIDHSIRIWNYARKKVELIKYFEDEVLSVAVHPTGLRLIVGFKFCMRMYNLLNNDLHQCCEFPVKQCYEVRFSPGGQYFAAAVVSRILIFNSYDFVCLGPLPGNTSVVKSICWSKNDRYLVSAEVNGVLFVWDISQMKAAQTDDSRKNVSYTCVSYDESTGSVVALGCNRLAEQGIPEGDVCIRNMNLAEATTLSTRLGYIHPNMQRREHTHEMMLSLECQTLFVGTPNGALLLFKWPIEESAQPIQKIDVHNGGILLLQMTSDHKHLFSVGDDNIMFMMEISGVVDGKPLSFTEFAGTHFEEVTYVLQEDMDRTVKDLDELQKNVILLQSETQDAIQAIRDRHNRDLVLVRRRLEEEVAELTSKRDQCLNDKQNAIENIRDNSRYLEGQHLKSAEALEQSYAQRAQEAHIAYNKLKIEKEDMIVRQESKIFKLAKEQAAEKALLQERIKKMESDLEADLKELEAKHSEATKRMDQMLDLAIEEYERMIDEINATNDKDIQRKQEEHASAANKTQTYKKSCEKKDEELKERKTTLERDEVEFRQKEEKIDRRKKEYETWKKEMSVRNETIAASEKKIGQLKKQTAELEKLRYVLTFKLTELRKEVAPKDDQISVLQQREKEMNQEYVKVCSDRETLEQHRRDKEDKLRVILRDIDKQKLILQDKERIIVAMLRELTDLTRSDELSDLIFKLKDIIMKFNVRYTADDAIVHKDQTGEFERQRDHMEAQIASISKQNIRKEEYLLQDNHRKTTENALLVREINELRHEIKYLSGKLELSETQLKEARVAVSRASTLSPGVSSSPTLMMPTGTSPTDDAKKSSTAASKKVSKLRSMTVDSARIAEIIAQVEANNAEMEVQQQEIHTLRSFVQVLLSHLEDSTTGGKGGDAGSAVPTATTTSTAPTPAAVLAGELLERQ